MSTIIQDDTIAEVDIDDLLNNSLIVHNDDINTFDHVIELLMRIVKHDSEQAEQCALIIHNKNRCIVKSGSMKILKPMKDLLIDGGLSVTIE